jgi:HEAT repeat protein
MSRLTRAIAIRPGEGRLVMFVAGGFAAVDAGRGMGEVGVDTLVLTRLGEDALPPLFIGLGLASLVLTLAYGAALSRSTSERFFPLVLVILAAALGLEWVLALSGVEAILPVIWVSIYAAGLLLLTAMWTVAGFTFDARQAKRLFPLLTSAAIVGSLAGYLSAIAVQRVVGSEALILAEALLFLVAAVLLFGLGPRIRPRRAPGESAPGMLAAVTSGGAYVAAFPLMRLVAVAYVLLAILLFSVTFPFLAAMNAAFPTEDELLPALAAISAVVTVASFLTGTLLANRLYARFGVATVALTLPLVYLVGFGLWIVRFGTTTAVVFRLTQQVTQRGISNAAWSAFYSVVPARRRGQVLAFMDGVPGQIGTMLSGALLIVATSLAMEQVFVLGSVAALACLGVGLRIRRAYASNLVATLREGRGEQVLEGGPGLQVLARDARVITELRAATRAPKASQRLLAADVLGRLQARSAGPDLRRLCRDTDSRVRLVALSAVAGMGTDEARDLLIEALRDEDAAVRARAIALLRTGLLDADAPGADLERLRRDSSPLVRAELAVALAAGGRVTAANGLIAALLGDPDPTSRTAALEVIARAPGVLEGPIPADLLADPSADVRAAALRALAARAEGAVPHALEALADPARDVRLAAAAILRQRADAGASVLEVLSSGPERAREPALLALEGHTDGGIRLGILAWSQEQVRRATELRGHAATFSGSAATDTSPSAAFLGEVMRRREEGIEAGLLQALSILGAPEASGLIRRCLHAVDPEVRAQAIEALDALGDPRLARGVVELLDRAPGADSGIASDDLAAATMLLDDRDPWVRVLALCTLSERLREEWAAIARLVREDPDPVVREAVEIGAVGSPKGGAKMPERLQLVSRIERMLALRCVPIFAALDPEDLQRVAASACERSWGPDDVVMAEGELGDELVVIVEGEVRVVHGLGSDEHIVRRFGVGDHIGELAVLREAPRAATVIAEASGLRGLVISGEAVRALLRERPEAATAMLATLADRISRRT